MQLAERPSATITLALCAVTAIATAAVTGRIAFEHRWHHGHHHHHSHIAFDQPGCRERIPPPAPAPAQPTYDSVLADAAPLFAHCFTHGARAAELLVTIAPDGRVRATTSRPEPATTTSRCLGNVVETLVFPPSPTTVMMRFPIDPPR